MVILFGDGEVCLFRVSEANSKKVRVVYWISE